MEKYIGTKIVRAEPSQRGECVKDTSQFSAFQLTEEGYRVGYPDGYVSWSPKDVFEKAYRRLDGLTFGLAIEALKDRYRVARAGWNGKGMWIVLVEPDDYALKCFMLGDAEQLAPYIAMQTADKLFIPWTASQTDILAEDWIIIE